MCSMIMHAIDYRYQLTRTSGIIFAQCLFWLFLEEFTVLLVTTSFTTTLFGSAFHVVVVLIGKNVWQLMCPEIKVLDSLVVAVVSSNFRNHSCCSYVYHFYFFNLKFGISVETRIALIFEMWTDKGFVQWEDHFFFCT